MARDVTAPPGTQTFVARQPIFDAQRRVFGYELLSRPVETPAAAPLKASRSGAQANVDALRGMGLDTLVGHRFAFVPVTREMLLEGVARLLPKERVVLQLGVDVTPDEDVVTSCKELVAAGFSIAIDDVVPAEGIDVLRSLASYHKVYLGADASTPQATREPGGPRLIAKGIETPEHFQTAVASGFPYMQGFFLRHPVMIPGARIDGGGIGRMRVLHALHNPLLSIGQVEQLIKPDTTICYHVLRTVNSAAFAQHRTVHSIHDALLLLGRDMICRWISVWTLAGLGREVHPELIAMSAARARCCELLGEAAGGEGLASEAFLVGLCSMLDAVLGMPMDAVIKAVPLSDDSKAALLGADNRLRWLIDCTASYERGDWDRSIAEATRVGLRPQDLPTAYLGALEWARELQR